jgi:hypothetical protein
MELSDINTVTSAPQDILKLMIFQKKENFIDALEAHNKINSMTGNCPTFEINARLKSLFYMVQGALQRDMNEQKYLDLKEKLDSKNSKDIIEVFEFINVWMDKKGLTRIDTKTPYDGTRVEKENEASHI